MYRATFHPTWSEYFNNLDHSVQEHVAKKIPRILEHPKKRHLKSSANYFVDEVGQYRLLYMVFEENQEVRFFFVGNHKQYEKWYQNYY